MYKENTVEAKIVVFVRYIVSLLARKDYHRIEQFSWIAPETKADLERYISNYGATIVDFPAGDDSFIDIRKTDGTKPYYHVIADLMTVEEGRSDLSLVLRLKEAENQQLKVESFDVDVL